MEGFIRKLIFLTFALAVAAILTASLMHAEDIPKAEYPVVTTSAGQSTDVETLNIIAEEAGIKYDYCEHMVDK